MVENLNYYFLLAGTLIALSVLASRVSARLGMPLLLLFLGLGMLAGEDGVLGIQFDDASSAYMIGNLALALILLDGGLRTRLSTFRAGLKPALVLATVGVFMTSGLVGLLAMWLFDLTLIEGLLVGAIVGSTDAAAVFSLLGGQGVHLNERVGATLEIESGTNDPMAIFLTITLAEILTGQLSGVASGIMSFLLQFGVGAAMGIAGGWLIARLMRCLDLAPGLYSLLALALGLSLFATTNEMGGSGFLAIYLCGLMIGNHPGRHLEHILPVHDGLAHLSQIVLFLMLGLLVSPSTMLQFALPAAILSVALILVVRPLAVILCLKPFFRFRWRELWFISWVGLRGAVPIVLAIFPVITGVENAGLYFNVAFFVVIISLLVQGSSLAPMARKLRVVVPPGAQPSRRNLLGIMPVNDYEMLVYRVDNTALEGVALRMLRFPSGAKVGALFRNKVLIHPKGSTCLHQQDVLCVVGRSCDVPSLNRMFNGESLQHEQRAFFGTFTLEGDANMQDIADVYGLTLSQGEQHLTIAEFITRRVGGVPVVGDDVDWHGIHWVVNEVEGNRITKVGLRLH